jgi:membrane protein implicated in regulation of membrane protease activity
MAQATPVIPPVAERTIWDLADRSLTIAMLAVAIYFVVKRLMRIETEKDTLMKSQIADLRGDVTGLKESVKECEKDRGNLYREIAAIKKG